MRAKLFVAVSVAFTLLLLASPVAFAQKGDRGGRGKGGHVSRGNQSDNHHDKDRHPHHWGNGSHWNWYAGTNGLGFYYGPRYTSCHNYYYPVAPWRPVVYQPWVQHWYFYSADPCLIHGYIHEGYCEYYYDDDGGCEVFWFP